LRLSHSPAKTKGGIDFSSETALSSELLSGQAGCCAATRLASNSESSEIEVLDIMVKGRESQSEVVDLLTEEDFSFGK
jgi:hypothetical protein